MALKLVKKNKNAEKTPKTKVARGESVGIDITPQHICAVQLNARGGGSLSLEKYAVVRLPANIVRDDGIAAPEKLVAQLQQIMRQLDSKCKNITTGMPHNMVNVQTLKYNPQQTELSLDEFVEVEVNQTSGGGSNYDYFVMPEREEGVTEMIVASCNADDVAGRMDIFKDAGIHPTQMDAALLSVVNAFSFWTNQKHAELSGSLCAIIHINHQTSNAIIVRDGMILYKQEINFGLDNLAQLIRSNYRVSETDAYDMTLSAKKPEGFEAQVGELFYAKLAQEIQRTIQFYQSTQSFDDMAQIQAILISGMPGAPDKRLAEVIQEQTGINTRVANPAAAFDKGSKINSSQLEADAGLLTAAFGMAVRGL